ncbi:MAG: diguanylate cyclase [Alphaproteobacteria bacterium]|nr:diguanylate cyclase [Alphaproteobacteria bacterium]
MLKKYIDYLRQVVPLMKNSWLPATLLLVAVSFFMFLSPFDKTTLTILHISFYIFNLGSILFLAKYNYNQPLFFVICSVLAYMFINYFKHTYGVIYYLTPAYFNLVCLSSIGLLFFYFLPSRPFFSYDSLKFFIIILVAFTLAEGLNKAEIKLDISPYINYGVGLQIFGMLLFSISLLSTMLHASMHNNIVNTGMAYSIVCISLGFYLSQQPSGLAIFFTTSSIILFISIVHHLFFIIRKDTATGLDNAHSFSIKTKKLPLKYGFGIICIDDYKHLLQAFSKTEVNDIMMMISKKICSLEPEASIYRCTPDEFIIIFLNAEKGTSYNKVDEIRRQIAASEFIINRIKKPLKITVSCCVADKKRSDSDVNSVFIRTHRVLQKTYKFTQNITSKA